MDISPLTFPNIPNQVPIQRAQEEEKKEQEVELPVHSFDPETLYTAIAIDLSASEIAAMNPDLLPKLAQYRKNDLFKIFEPWIVASEKELQKKIQTTLITLYLLGLMNSTFEKITEDLEKNIADYLPRTTKEKFQTLIKNGDLAIATHPPKTLADAEKEVIRLSAITQEINGLLMLFSYLEPENLERIEMLYTYAQKPNGTLRFPNCETHFSDLCLNLQINQNERSELRNIQKCLMKKIWDLRKFIKRVCSPSPISERERLYSNHAVAFWEAGVKILELALQETFTKKRENRRFYLPEGFVNAVRNASKLEGFRYRNFQEMVDDRELKLAPQFILAIWGEYMGPLSSINDAADLMNFILSKLNENQFLKLQNELKKPLKRDEIIFTTAKDFLIGQIRGNITFLSLKYWVTKK